MSDEGHESELNQSSVEGDKKGEKITSPLSPAPLIIHLLLSEECAVVHYHTPWLLELELPVKLLTKR